MKTMHMFIAAQLSAEAKQELEQVAGKLMTRVPERSIRWVKPNRIHITLCFLGETAVSKLDAIAQTMDTVANNQPPLSLRLQGTGCFPNVKRPRVIWVGLAGQVPELTALKHELDCGLEPLGWQPEKRPFKPHLTLGRVKDARKLRGINLEVSVKELAVPVTAVHLIESELTRQGPIYTTRHTTELA